VPLQSGFAGGPQLAARSLGPRRWIDSAYHKAVREDASVSGLRVNSAVQVSVRICRGDRAFEPVLRHIPDGREIIEFRGRSRIIEDSSIEQIVKGCDGWPARSPNSGRATPLGWLSHRGMWLHV
jgi:hypothetical protein